MNLLFVGDIPLNGFSGAAHRLPPLASSLERLGVTCHFHLKNPHPNRYLNILSTIGYPLTTRRRLKHLLNKLDIDIIVGSMPSLAGGIPAALWKGKNPFILDVADYEYYTPFWRAFRPLNSISLKKATAITTINDPLFQHLCTLGVPAHRITTIPNGVDFTLFKPFNTLKLHPFRDRPLLIHVGACYSLLFILKTIPRVIKQRPDALFLFVGLLPHPPLSQRLKLADFKDNVTFIDPLPQIELVKYINAADIGIHFFNPKSTYLDLAQPLKVLEYSACLKPTVTRPLSGVYDIFRPSINNTAFCECFASTPAKFARQILWLLSEDGEPTRLEIGRLAYERIKTRHDWAKIAPTFKTLCETLLRK